MAHLGSTRVILELHWENGKPNGNYYLGFRVWSIGSPP